MNCGQDGQYSDCVVGWTVSTVTVLLDGQSVQQKICGLDGQYSDCVVGWNVTTINVLWAGQSVQ